MKTVSVRELQKHIGECVQAAQRGHVVVTKHGKPALLLVGVAGKDWETLYWETDTALWRTLAKRRAQPTISMAAMKRQLAAVKRKAPKRVRRKA